MSRKHRSRPVAVNEALLEEDEPVLFDGSFGFSDILRSGGGGDAPPRAGRPDHPRLTLVHPDDNDGLIPLAEDDEDAGGSASADDGPLWSSGEADAVDLKVEQEAAHLAEQVIAGPADRAVGVIDDHSATDDVILRESPAETIDLKSAAANPANPRRTPTGRPMPPLPEPGEISQIAAGHQTRRQTPMRIGSGRLVPARLTWKPGDPFCDSSNRVRRFRWEIMLTAACGTAVCGMGAIWLLGQLIP
ncbi:MAG: hypothetical protein ACE5F9_11330 [Phycisphaerae bacterium]